MHVPGRKGWRVVSMELGKVCGGLLLLERGCFVWLVVTVMWPMFLERLTNAGKQLNPQII